MTKWTWATATPKERANAVRNHLKMPELTVGGVRTLFNLTDRGISEIMHGSDWKPEHDAPTTEPQKPLTWKQRLAAEDAQFADQKRIERQRTLFVMLPDTRAVDQLKEAMLARAWALLDEGKADACDALLEFVPIKDAEKMLNEYFKEEDAA